MTRTLVLDAEELEVTTDARANTPMCSEPWVIRWHGGLVAWSSKSFPTLSTECKVMEMIEGIIMGDVDAILGQLGEVYPRLRDNQAAVSEKGDYYLLRDTFEERE